MTTLTLSPDPDFGRMRCIVQGGTGGALTRDGEVVRGGESVTGDIVVDDYEAPFGVELTYAIENSGDQIATLDSDYSWLTSATDPGVAVTVRDQDPRTYEAPGRTYRRLGSQWPIAVHTVRRVHSGTLDLLADSDLSDRLRELIADGTPLLLRTPPDCSLDDLWLWPGVITRSRSTTPTTPRWVWSMEYQRVEGPVGSVQIDPSNSWTAFALTHPSWDEVPSGDLAPTDVLTNPARWSSWAFGYAYGPHPTPVVEAGGIRLSWNAAPSQNPDSNAGQGGQWFTASTGRLYRAQFTVQAASGSARWRPTVAFRAYGPWRTPDGTEQTAEVAWTADDTAPLFGIEVESGDWPNAGSHLVKAVTVVRADAAGHPDWFDVVLTPHPHA